MDRRHLQGLQLERRRRNPGILAAWEELDTYIDDMVAHRRHTLTDDLISELTRAEDDGDRLGAAVHVLCDHPDQWSLLAECPELAVNAVEETMRHSPIALATLRTAIDDVAGVMIPAGTLVLVNTGAANRDPAVYDDPGRLDPVEFDPGH